MAATKKTSTATRKKATRKTTTRKKAAPKKNNFQKWIAYMKKYPPTGGAPVPSGSTVIVTARPKDSGFVPDRSFAELDAYFNQGIFPLLRVIEAGGTVFYPLKSYMDGVFLFGQIDVTISPDKIRTTVVTNYAYSETSFKAQVDASSTQDVDLKYVDL